MSSKPEPEPEPIIYAPIPSDPNYVVLQLYPRRRSCLRRHLRRSCLSVSLLLLLSLSIFLLFPSDPHLQLVRVKLDHISLQSFSLRLSLSLTLRVRNPDFFSLHYRSLAVSVAYRGTQLGFVDSPGGTVRARGSSYVNASLLVDGFQVLHDFIYLIEDVAAGRVPFDTVSSVDGDLGLLFFKIPIQAKVSCEVDVNPKDQTITHQNCYPE